MAAALSPVLAGASTPSPNAHVPVADGLKVSALPGTTVFGFTDPSTPETVSFIMNANHLNQREQMVSAPMRSFLSVAQFAQTYGASPSALAALTHYLAHYGIATSVVADGLDVVANGTAGEFDAALATSQENLHVPAYPGHDGQAAAA